MCGRFGYINKDVAKIEKRFRLKKINFDLVPRYNIAPGQGVGVILNQEPEELRLARWGLVPSWAKDEKIGYKMINARAETIFEKPSYRTAIKKRRCLIPADFFFEWKKEGSKKQPYCIRLKSKETFSLAGIWDRWQEELISCSIITCEPNDMMAGIHDRMPVILERKNEQAWLEGNDIERWLKPFSPGLLEAYAVSTLVNSPANDTEEIMDHL